MQPAFSSLESQRSRKKQHTGLSGQCPLQRNPVIEAETVAQRCGSCSLAAAITREKTKPQIHELTSTLTPSHFSPTHHGRTQRDLVESVSWDTLDSTVWLAAPAYKKAAPGTHRPTAPLPTKSHHRDLVTERMPTSSGNTGHFPGLRQHHPNKKFQQCR